MYTTGHVDSQQGHASSRQATSRRTCGRRRAARGVWVVATLLGAPLLATEAEACGGLFCSSDPVNQTAERIVFAERGDGHIDAIIEIQYQGPSDQFAWLLPMPGVPEVSVSAQAVLDAIDNATAPSYRLEYEYGGACAWDEGDEESESDVAASVDAGANEGGGGIDVLDQGTAGPYDYVIIRADPELTDAALVAVDWLVEAGYDVGELGPDVLRPYLDQGLNLVAFRLTKGNDVGAIRPVMLTYEGEVPSIPIRPTAVAAQPDMGIAVYVLGEERAVSDNYLNLELNESRINWFNFRSNYGAVINAAADEAGGHGFVTEYAGDTERLQGRIWTRYAAERWQALQARAAGLDGDGGVVADVESAIDLMMDARWPFGSYEGFRRAIAAATTLPDDLSLDVFAGNPYYYQDRVEVNVELFLQTLADDVIEPLSQAQELIDGYPYLTRLYTTLSPHEMVIDPSFVFNPNLPDVSNVHKAGIRIECSDKYPYPWEAPWTITLPDGNTISGIGDGSWLPELNDLPAAASATQVGQDDEGVVVFDNRDEIAAALDAMAAAFESTHGLDNRDESTDVSTPDGSRETDDEELTDVTDGRDVEIDRGQDGTDVDTSTDSTGTGADSKDDDGWCSVARPRLESRTSMGGLGGVLWLAALALMRRRR